MAYAPALDLTTLFEVIPRQENPCHFLKMSEQSVYATQKLETVHGYCYLLVDKWAKVGPNVYLCKSVKTPNKLRTKNSIAYRQGTSKRGCWSVRQRDTASTVHQQRVNRPSTVHQWSINSPSTVIQQSSISPATIRQQSVNSPSIDHQQLGRSPSTATHQQCIHGPRTVHQQSINNPSTVYEQPIHSAATV